MKTDETGVTLLGGTQWQSTQPNGRRSSSAFPRTVQPSDAKSVLLLLCCSRQNRVQYDHGLGLMDRCKLA